jgi:hypothetical protein
MYEQKGDNMSIITTVEIALGRLRIFRRVRVMEAKQEATEKTVAALIRRVEALEALAGACPYKNRAEEPVDRAAEPSQEYNTEETFICWTEGETDADKMRDERLRAARERGGSGA